MPRLQRKPTQAADPMLAELKKLTTLSSESETRLGRVEGTLFGLQAEHARERLNANVKFTEINQQLRDHTQVLEEILTTVRTISQEVTVRNETFRRLERRDAVFAKALKLDLDKLDE